MNALRRPSTAVNALLALLIVGATGWGWTLLRDTSSSTVATASDLRIVAATTGTVTRTVAADGSVASAVTATAAFRTPGIVTGVQVEVGDEVRKGQLLARVDATGVRRDLELARANLTAARDALDRAEAAGTDPTSAVNEIARAEVAVERAEAAVEGTTLTAPMAGTVTAVNGTLGAATGATGGFVELADLDRLQIAAAFAESAAAELEPGQSATVSWNALPGAETTGQVVAVDPTATTSEGVVSYGVTVSLPNPPEGTRPGQTVTVSVITGSVENAVTVNAAAVTTVGDRRTVSVLDEAGRQETRQVRVGLEGDEAYQILSGLTAGERVVIPAVPDTGGRGPAPAGGR